MREIKLLAVLATVHTSGTPTTTESPIGITFECNIPSDDGLCVSLNCADSASYTWHDAKAACEDHDTYMATISRIKQNLDVSSALNGKRVWLGLTDEVNEGRVDNSNLYNFSPILDKKSDFFL